MGVQTFGRQTYWAKDYWATDDWEKDVWSTQMLDYWATCLLGERPLGDKILNSYN